jgi:hypothetical protein
MFWASLCPSLGKQEQDWRLESNNSFQKVHTAYTMAQHNHSQHNQESSHEILTSFVLVLLMMGIIMPETC